MKLVIGFWLFVAPIFFAAKAPADADVIDDPALPRVPIMGD